MSTVSFESHCGAASAKKWKESIRLASSGTSMGSWLRSVGGPRHGLLAPGTRLGDGIGGGSGGKGGDGGGGGGGAPGRVGRPPKERSAAGGWVFRLGRVYQVV